MKQTSILQIHPRTKKVFGDGSDDMDEFRFRELSSRFGCCIMCEELTQFMHFITFMIYNKIYDRHICFNCSRSLRKKIPKEFNHFIKWFPEYN